MIKRIYLFMPINSQYGVLHHFTEKLHEAFLRAGVNSTILVADKNNPRPFLSQIFNDPPDCTLSFNGVLPDEQGRFLCDMLKIPHVCCLVDTPTRFIPLIQSAYNIITCMDLSGCSFYKQLHHEQTFFLPHAVEKNLTYLPSASRPYDVVFLGSCIDFKPIADRWRERYPKPIADMLFEAAEITLSEEETSYIQGLILATENLKRKDPDFNIDQIDFITCLDDLETYVIGQERIRLIQEVKDARIDIFGNSKPLWESYLKGQSNCVFHDPVTFNEAFDLMRKAKVLLHSCAAIKAGGHERIYTGMALGAALVARENEYMKETFENDKNICFYTNKDFNTINDRINLLLTDETKRASLAKAGHDVVMANHTWDDRANTLLKTLPSFLERKGT